MHSALTMRTRLSAFCRAYQTENALFPVLDDPVVGTLLGASEYAHIADELWRGLPFLAPSVAAQNRSRADSLLYLTGAHFGVTEQALNVFFEENALAGIRQILLLGAPLNTLVFRRAATLMQNRCRVFDCDTQSVTEQKQARMSMAGLTLPSFASLLSYDGSALSLQAALATSGWRTDLPSAVFWPEALYLLTEPEILAHLCVFACLLAPGSCLYFDFAEEGFLRWENPRSKSFCALLRADGQAVRTPFGFAALESLLEDCGFALGTLLEPEDIRRRILVPAGSDLTAMPHRCFVCAQRKFR